MCFLPFEQLIEQQVVQLHESISKCLHHHTFFSMFFNGMSEAHSVWILSRFGPKVNVWLTTQQVFPTFQLPSLIFSTTLRTWLGLPHPFIYMHPLMCVNTSHQPYGYPLFTLCSWQQTHWNPWCNSRHFLPPLPKMLVSMWDKNNYMHFLQSHSSPFVNELTLCLPKMAFAP